MSEAMEKLLSSPEAKNAMMRAMMQPLLPQKGHVPEGAKCLKCGSENLSRTVIPAGGPWSGRVTCGACGHTTSVMNHVVESCITVVPPEQKP